MSVGGQGFRNMGVRGVGGARGGEGERGEGGGREFRPAISYNFETRVFKHSNMALVILGPWRPNKQDWSLTSLCSIAGP